MASHITTSFGRRSRALMAIGALAAATFGAEAAGGQSDDQPSCPRGEVRNNSTGACEQQRSSSLTDADRARYAYALAKAGRYQEALGVLDTLRQPDTREAWNYRGFATRKLGRTDEGIGYYLKAVALDPKYTLVREYLGEAYVIKGRIDLAEQQLAAIESLCGKGCEEYRDLAAAIQGKDTD